MKKTAKIILLSLVFVFVGICLFFFLYNNPADQEITITTPPNSIDYSKGEGTDDTDPNPEDPPIIIPDDDTNDGNQDDGTDDGNNDDNGDPDDGNNDDSGNDEFITFDNFNYNHYDLTYKHDGRTYHRDSTYYADMVLVNFNTSANFSMQSHEEMYDDLQYIENYFSIVSRGNFHVKFNLFLYNANESHLPWLMHDYPYNTESAMYEKAMEGATTIVDHGGTDNLRILNLSSSTQAVTASSMWPHCYPSYTRGMDLMVLNSEQDQPNIIIHEFFHALGIMDMYTGSQYPMSDPEPLETCDMMSTGTYNDGYCATSAQNLFLLGWLGNVTPYEDDTTSFIENISKPGVYTLQNEFSANGPIAYRFGTLKDEFFLIEVRSMKNGSDLDYYLVVQRINMKYRENNDAKNEGECMILGMKNQRNSFYGVEDDAFGLTSCPIYYSDDTLANFSIANIQILPNGRIQFELFNTTNPTIGDTNDFIDDGKNNFYIYVADASNNFMPATSILVYDPTTNTWKQATDVALVYINGKKHYALLDLNEVYTQVKIVYSAYGFTDSKTVNLTSKYISVQFEKNVIQITGDFLNGIKDSIGNFFGGLFS